MQVPPAYIIRKSSIYTKWKFFKSGELEFHVRLTFVQTHTPGLFSFFALTGNLEKAYSDNSPRSIFICFELSGRYLYSLCIIIFSCVGFAFVVPVGRKHNTNNLRTNVSASQASDLDFSQHRGGRGLVHVLHIPSEQIQIHWFWPLPPIKNLEEDKHNFVVKFIFWPFYLCWKLHEEKNMWSEIFCWRIRIPNFHKTDTNLHLRQCCWNCITKYFQLWSGPRMSDPESLNSKK